MFCLEWFLIPCCDTVCLLWCPTDFIINDEIEPVPRCYLQRLVESKSAQELQRELLVRTILFHNDCYVQGLWRLGRRASTMVMTLVLFSLDKINRYIKIWRDVIIYNVYLIRVLPLCRVA